MIDGTADHGIEKLHDAVLVLARLDARLLDLLPVRILHLTNKSNIQIKLCIVLKKNLISQSKAAYTPVEIVEDVLVDLDHVRRDGDLVRALAPSVGRHAAQSKAQYIVNGISTKQDKLHD